MSGVSCAARPWKRWVYRVARGNRRRALPQVLLIIRALGAGDDIRGCALGLELRRVPRLDSHLCTAQAVGSFENSS